MRARITAILAYTGAAATLAVVACTPFVLMGFFTNAVARTGIRVDPVYSGGAVARTIACRGYRIDVYQPVRQHALQAGEPFVQIAFRPVSALPKQVSEEVDLDGDGQPDVRVSFTVPADPRARPAGEVVALNGKFQDFTMPTRVPESAAFSELMVQSNGAVLIRVPLLAPANGALH